MSDDNYNIDYLLGIASHVEDKGMEEDFLDAEHIRLAAELIERFRKERDEARREICINEANELAFDLERKGVFGITGKSMAEKRGWDCFKEDERC